ncbi:hypothetical protein FOCC_FOCC004807 [Frankliniella occidentalis]|nr:hypothetical protein FOCC_FOCC004807 [Frankliniella occidentalis]
MPPGGLAVPPGPGGPPVGPSGPGGAGGAAIVVRAEEALLVLLVLVLWVAAIALFFNRWGKIRMLEPYQPKFQQHRQSCALVDISGTTQVKSAMDLQTLVLSEHEPALGPLGPIGATTSASVLPTCSPSMRRASHVPVGSVPLGAIRHHASFSHASFSEHQPSCSYHRFELRAPGGLPSGLASIPGPNWKLKCDTV